MTFLRQCDGNDGTLNRSSKTIGFKKKNLDADERRLLALDHISAYLRPKNMKLFLREP